VPSLSRRLELFWQNFKGVGTRVLYFVFSGPFTKLYGLFGFFVFGHLAPRAAEIIDLAVIHGILKQPENVNLI